MTDPADPSPPDATESDATESDAAPPDRPGGQDSQLSAALEAFKPRAPAADTSPVSESGRSGLTWSPVIDADREAAPEPEQRPRSSFQFDLGSALARLDGVDVTGPTTGPAREPSPSAPTTSDPIVTGARVPDAPDDVVEPLPVRGAAAPTAPAEPDVASPDQVVSSDDVVEPLPVRGARTNRPVTPPAVHAPTDPADGVSEPAPAATQAPAPTSDRPPVDDGPPVVDRLPTRGQRPDAAPTEAPVPASATPPPAAVPAEAPVARAQPQRSVFDTANPTPTLPSGGAGGATAGHLARATAPQPMGDAPFLPTLPAAVPAAPPPIIEPVQSAPSTPDLNALRSAQLRAGRNDRKGKLFGRSLLALIVVGSLVGSALLFGRSYLFPTEWEPALTPLVDEIQRARQTEFDGTIGLIERPASEYAPLVATHVLGDDWNSRLPEWRALGLAVGDGSVADVQIRIAALYPAFYDRGSNTIVVSADRSTEARQPALRLALESALAAQRSDESTEASLGLTGLERVDELARRAFDAAASDVIAASPEAVADLGAVPIPVAYQLRAMGALGTALVDGVPGARAGDELPPSAERLDDGAVAAPGGLRQPGDQPVFDARALGTDDWALIWGSRLAPAVVARMVNAVVADSYSVVNRSGVTCFIAVFGTGSEAAGNSLLGDLQSWVANSPSGSQATAIQLGPDRLQVEACDPGADAAGAPSSAGIDLVIGRQLDRIAD